MNQLEGLRAPVTRFTDLTDTKPASSQNLNLDTQPDIQTSKNLIKVLVGMCELTPYNKLGVVEHILKDAPQQFTNVDGSKDQVMSKMGQLAELTAQATQRFDSPEEMKKKLEVKTNDIKDVCDSLQDTIRKKQIKSEYDSKKLRAEINLASDKTTSQEATDSLKDSDPNADESYAELWQRISQSIGDIKKDYLDTYANALSLQAQIYQLYNERVAAALAGAVTEGSDANHVHFDQAEFMKTVSDYQAQVDKLTKAWIPPTFPDYAKHKEEINAIWEPAFNITDDGKVTVNDDLIKGILASLPPTGEISTPSYQAFLAKFNNVGSTFQSNMQAFAQHYSQANSTYDNLVKVLSSTISELAEAAKAVLKALS